ncbi:hypothetical protein LCGC14_1175900 [marine sediment metagenome]|uniref:GIY-YIG domain-containing protein n=1 Tax=marine sediment metagenome TaxID=412755 RepID=A0A0F9LTE0_9ZZZZ
MDRYYIGESPEPGLRLELHNAHHFKRAFTKAADDWEIALSKECSSKEDTLYLERFIKRMKPESSSKK